LIDRSDDGGEGKSASCVGPNPIPGGVAPFAPSGIFIHHNPLHTTLASLNDPSQITDFDPEQSGLQFQSDAPPDPRANIVSVLGREQNGVFFS
jgi:hypothetical protein